MNENITCCIDCNKISTSINNLIPVYNLINNINIYEGIQDVDSEITKINFEHGNCIDNYKEQIRNIYNEIDLLQKDINSLFEGLNYTIENTNSETINDLNHIKKITDFYQGTSASTNIFNAFKQISTSVSSNQEQPYSTVPIGLGIAASGISAAAGTVLVDSMYSNDSKNEKIENLDDYENEEEKQVQDNESESKYEMDEIPTPYHASRDKIIANKFYEGNEDRNEEYEEI